jgi:hypothetical protein
MISLVLICLDLLRASFFRFSNLFRDHGLLKDTIHMCVEQQVAMFLHTIGHNIRNRVVAPLVAISTKAMK